MLAVVADRPPMRPARLLLRRRPVPRPGRGARAEFGGDVRGGRAAAAGQRPAAARSSAPSTWPPTEDTAGEEDDGMAPLSTGLVASPGVLSVAATPPRQDTFRCAPLCGLDAAGTPAAPPDADGGAPAAPASRGGGRAGKAGKQAEGGGEDDERPTRQAMDRPDISQGGTSHGGQGAQQGAADRPARPRPGDALHAERQGGRPTSRWRSTRPGATRRASASRWRSGSTSSPGRASARRATSTCGRARAATSRAGSSPGATPTPRASRAPRSRWSPATWSCSTGGGRRPGRRRPGRRPRRRAHRAGRAPDDEAMPF